MNVLEQFYRAKWTDHDVEKALSLISDDFIYEDVGVGVRYDGKADYAAYVNDSARAIPALTVEFASTSATGDRCAAEALMSGVMDHDLVGHRATGEPFTARYSIFGTVRDGLLTSVTVYWNPADWAPRVEAEASGQPTTRSRE